MELTDPYERQLLAVFESCDVKGTGRLDCDGLTKLCDQLHLEDGRNQLMDCLLPAFTFHQFRDALLALLGASRRHSDADREPSPGQYSSWQSHRTSKTEYISVSLKYIKLTLKNFWILKWFRLKSRRLLGKHMSLLNKERRPLLECNRQTLIVPLMKESFPINRI